MKAIIVALGSAGDVHPFLGIARVLQARGHDVTVLASSFFEELIGKIGLRFGALGTRDEHERVMHHPHAWHPRKSLPLLTQYIIAPALRPTYDYLRAHCADDRCIVLASTLAFGARVAQEALGLRVVTAHLSPSIFRSVYRPAEYAGLKWLQRTPRSLQRLLWYAIDRAAIDPSVAPALNAFRRELKLPDVQRIFQRWVHSPTRVLALFPEWFAAPQPDWPAQTVSVGFPLYDESELHAPPLGLEEFLRAGAAPVVFTPGSANVQAAGFFRTALAACERAQRRALFLTPYVEQVPPHLPDSIRHFAYVPLSRLLPHAAALVYHGGIGTCAQACRAGIPHLVVPMAYDQYDNAARIETLGIGARLEPRAFTASALAARLDDLLRAEPLQDRCRDIAHRLTAGRAAAEAACDILEREAG